MEVIHQFPGGAWLTNDEANHRIALLHSPHVTDDPDKIVHAGIHHTAFEFDSIGELLATWERLRDRDIRPHMVLDHGMTLSFYFVDPDGNSVELQADHFGDWSKSKEFMRSSPEFEADPIGKFVDPGPAAGCPPGGHLRRRAAPPRLRRRVRARRAAGHPVPHVMFAA